MSVRVVEVVKVSCVNFSHFSSLSIYNRLNN